MQIIDNGIYRDATPAEVAEIEAREMAALNAQIAAAVARTYQDVDKVYADAIGNRATEYQEAEDAARAFAAAGYTGEVSDYISCYARSNPTGQQQSNQWAADGIIERADAFRAAVPVMRATRMDCQAAMRAAASVEELAAAISVWDGFIAATRDQLGL